MAGARGKNSNTFRQGLNTDMHPLDTSKEVMTDNSNATLITSEGDEFILQNMRGNELKASLTEGFRPMAVKVFNNVAYIISQSIANPTIGEIGTFPSPDWAELNKQIPVVKDKMDVSIIPTSNTDRPTLNVPITFTRVKTARRIFTGQWKTQSQVGNDLGGTDFGGCLVCEWRGTFSDGTILGPHNPGTVYSKVFTTTNDNGLSTSFTLKERRKASPVSNCDCNLPGVWAQYTNAIINEAVTDDIVYTYTINSLLVFQGVDIEIDFTNSGVQGVINASQSDGILNATSTTLPGFPPVNGMVIDASTGIVKMKLLRVGPHPLFTIETNVAHTPNNISQNPITGSSLGANVTEFKKTYDITALALTPLQLATATFSLYHKNTYPQPQLLASDIKYKVNSVPIGIGPTVYQDIVLAPGEEVQLGITGISGVSTLELFIEYPGSVFNAEQINNYELFIIYESEEGEVLVNMSNVYSPLHNFYDYDGLYYDSTALPLPGNPPTDSDLDTEGYYVAPLRTPSFNFSKVQFVDLELQPAYDRSVNIVYTDGKNRPKIFNSRFIVKAGNNQATIADRQGVRDTNIYSNERWANTDLIVTAETIASLKFEGFESGGSLLPGGYRFYFVYTNSDLQTSSVFTESRLVQVTKGEGESTSGGDPIESTGKTVHFSLTDLDTKFLYVKVFYARDIGEFNSGTFGLHEVFNLFPIRTEGSIDIRITGFELTNTRAQGYLETVFTDFTNIKTLTSIQGSLAVANVEISVEHLDYLRTVSSTLKIEQDEALMSDIDIKNSSKTIFERRSPYKDAENVYHNLGYWTGETYEVGIVFKMTDSNLLSPVIPIRGIDNFENSALYTGAGVYPAPGFILPVDDPNNTRENTNGVFRVGEGKIIMDGSGLSGGNSSNTSPNITYLKVAVSTLLGDTFLRDITSGFFFVRKQRLKDCQYEGLISQVAAVPLSTPTPNVETARVTGTTGGLGSMDNITGNFIAVKKHVSLPEFNTDATRASVPCKYIPVPGGFINAVYPAYASTTSNPKFDRAVTYLSNPYDSGTAVESANDVWSHFSFYTPDIVTRPTDVASFFSGTGRGLRYAQNAIYANSGNRSPNNFRTEHLSLVHSFYRPNTNAPIRQGQLTTFGMQTYTLNSLRWSYITAGQDVVTPETFTALLQEVMSIANARELNAPDYGWERGDGNANEWKGEGTGAASSGMMVHKFDDYVGMQVIGGDTGDLRDRMQHLFGPGGIIRTTVGSELNAINKDALYDAMENNEVSLGVLARVYPTSQGPLTKGTNWQGKYQSTTSTGYFAITDRYSWERADAEFAGVPVKLFDGDCYIGDHYKRINYKLGIQEDPAATDPSLYARESAGLADAGLIVAITMSSSTNFSIRSEQFKSASERLVYGTDRSFFPLYTISEIRTKKQLDSKLYYAGFNLEAAALNYSRQAIELPAIVDFFPYRVYISAPADLTSFTNGYRNFSGLNFRDYDSAFGQIIKLISLQSMLYVVWEYGIGRIFTQEKTVISDEDGGVFVNQASRLHPQAQVVSNKYGSTDPYSIIVSADSIYGIDWTNNKIWQVNAAGQFAIISDFKIERLLTKVKADLLNNNVLPKFFSGYDTYKRNVYFNYSGYNASSNATDPIPIGSIYYNETLKIWVSSLTFYPYFIFNLRENWYSFNFEETDPTLVGNIWEHESELNPLCNFYGVQHPFEYEFILVDNPAIQKIINNLKIISTEEYPLTVTYSIIDKHDYETNEVKEISLVDRLIKRYKKITAQLLATVAGSSYIAFTSDPSILAGEHIVVNQGTKYEVQDVVEYLGVWYVYVLYADPVTGAFINTVSEAYADDAEVIINNGIIKENIIYKEDHFYIVVGNKLIVATDQGELKTQPDELPSIPEKGTSSQLGVSGIFDFVANLNLLGKFHFANKLPAPMGTPPPSGDPGITPGTPTRVLGQVQLSAPRDKYIRIKIRYKGDKQVFIQAVESMFTYSFS